MTGKICKGALFIERFGILTEQQCPYDNGHGSICGTWCPLFGEARMTLDGIDLDICGNKHLIFSELDTTQAARE